MAPRERSVSARSGTEAVTTEKGLAILDEVLAEYEARGRRDVVVVLRVARLLLSQHGLEGNEHGRERLVRAPADAVRRRRLARK